MGSNKGAGHNEKRDLGHLGEDKPAGWMLRTGREREVNTRRRTTRRRRRKMKGTKRGARSKPEGKGRQRGGNGREGELIYMVGKR